MNENFQYLRIVVGKQLLEVFCKEGVIKNVANFTVKRLRWSLFLINSHAWRDAILLERESKEKNRYFYVKFANF